MMHPLSIAAFLSIYCPILFISAGGPKTVCYDNYGCFGITGPFEDKGRRPFPYLPQDPATLQVQYHFYLRPYSDFVIQEVLYDDLQSIEDSTFRSDRQTKIIVHGQINTIYEENSWVVDMKYLLLQTGDYNVILIDWSKGNGIIYSQAVANTRIVGALIAELIEWLEVNKRADRSDFHIIGHSLGAHVAGYAGARLTKPHKLGQITGLDPADPEFQDMPEVVRLDPDDADFVDVIHTDGDPFARGLLQLTGGLGASQPMGHLDFYPNGGERQPGCDRVGMLLGKNGPYDLPDLAVCDHLRVLKLYRASIFLSKAADFLAFECESWEAYLAGLCLSCEGNGCAYMGIRAKEWDKGKRKGKNVKMYLVTNGRFPYYTHQVSIKLNLASNFRGTKHGDVYVRLGNEYGKLTNWMLAIQSVDLPPSRQVRGLFTTNEDVLTISRVQVRWVDKKKGLFHVQKAINVHSLEIAVGISQFSARLPAFNSLLVGDTGVLSLLIRKNCASSKCRRLPSFQIVNNASPEMLAVDVYATAAHIILYTVCSFRLICM